MGELEAPQKPNQRWEFTIKFGGNTIRDIVRTLNNLSTNLMMHHVDDIESFTMGGEPDVTAIYRPDMTEEQYHKDLFAYRDYLIEQNQIAEGE